MMIQTENLPSKIAQLEYQKGLFSESLLWADKVAKDGLSKKNYADWFDCLRLLLLSGFETENLKPFENYLPHLINAGKEIKGPEKAAVQYLLAHYFLLKQSEEAEAYIAEAITSAAQLQNLIYLARSLALASHYYCIEPHRNLSKAIEYLDKLDVVIGELSLKDLNITSLILRAYALGGGGHSQQAFDYIWKAYEQAQHSGYQIAIPSILTQIARLYQQQNRSDLFQMYADLALRGVHAKNHPRLYRQISEFCSFYSAKPITAYDFILDEDAATLRERNKGYIDFKNQHILFDLTLLFLKSPGTRFNKEELIEIIWKQAYDSESHDNLIYVSIKRLRFLLEPNCECPRYILRDRKGYYLNSETQIHIAKREDNTP
ncbi:MAG: winged helix-turn-helix domain-containing protein [Bdellovibrio sp.]